MRKTGIVVLLGIGMLSSLWLLRPVPANAQAQGEGDGGSGLQQFAGTAWVVFEIPGLGPLPAIATAHADGTFIIVDGTDEGLGGSASVDSASLGVFKRTGPRQTTGRTVFLSFDGGIPIAAVVIDLVSDYNADLSAGTGVAQQRVYDLTIGENPLDPNQGTPTPGEIPYQFGALMTP